MITKEDFINKKLDQMCKHCHSRQELFDDLHEFINGSDLDDLSAQYAEFCINRFEKRNGSS